MKVWTTTLTDTLRIREYGDEDTIAIREIYNQAKQETYRYSFEHNRKEQILKTCGYANPYKSISFSMGKDGRLSKINIFNVKTNDKFLIVLNHTFQTAKIKDRRASTLLPIPSSEALYIQLEGLTVPIDGEGIAFLSMMFI